MRLNVDLWDAAPRRNVLHRGRDLQRGHETPETQSARWWLISLCSLAAASCAFCLPLLSDDQTQTAAVFKEPVFITTVKQWLEKGKTLCQNAMLKQQLEDSKTANDTVLTRKPR